jgi:hypothetical protein
MRVPVSGAVPAAFNPYENAAAKLLRDLSSRASCVARKPFLDCVMQS